MFRNREDDDMSREEYLASYGVEPYATMIREKYENTLSEKEMDDIYINKFKELNKKLNR